ncbi:MAG: CRISPR-associated endonuclease Cas1 [Terriglobales bacterium]
MAASTTVPQPPLSSNPPVVFTSSVPRCGVVTLYGYGIQVRVDRGHLTIEHGLSTKRQHMRLPRVGHGLRRLIVIGSDGMLSLAALRWLADQDACFVMLERDGSVLATTGPVRPSDSRLRRAQALAPHSGADVVIARELISQKLAAQERVARDKLQNVDAAQTISDYRLALAEAETLEAVRFLESQGAAAYWAAWRSLPILFPRQDLPRVPEHWRTFGTRKSLLTGSQRLATNPANAMLNYLYAILEAESRLAAAALGLDPGLGFIHVDAPARDSLACDLMEPIRAKIDEYVLGFIQQPLRREWFFEQRDGNCRLMAKFAAQIAETAPIWARAVAPVAEWVARQLWTRQRRAERETTPPTRLTQRHKRAAKGADSIAPAMAVPKRENLCRGCGRTIEPDSVHCLECNKAVAAERLTEYARIGREIAHAPEAKARRSETMRQRNLARYAWRASDQPTWLTEDVYTNRIQPALANMTNAAVAKAMGVSIVYATDIRRGKRQPHERHWQRLADLVGARNKTNERN